MHFGNNEILAVEFFQCTCQIPLREEPAPIATNCHEFSLILSMWLNYGSHAKAILTQSDVSSGN